MNLRNLGHRKTKTDADQDTRGETRRQPHWSIPVLASALLGAVLAATIGHSQVVGVWHSIERTITGAPSFKEATVNGWLGDARTASFWSSAPSVDGASAQYLRTHFGNFDPRRLHSYTMGASYHMDVGPLAVHAPLLAGTPVDTMGRVVDERVVQPGSPHAGFYGWQVELQDPHAKQAPDDQGVAYCWISLPSENPDPSLVGDSGLPPPGALLMVSGLVVAQGQSQAGAPAVYLVCNAMEGVVIMSRNGTPNPFGTP